ncbi:hypothetical protein FSARC_15068 [Fusarium sarcochroum]|uniref:Polyketide cyclase/dehydrase n=1 Tax=Fusarium sarcochroum TaxID=1208366 RepID=A0A8H4WMB8_9HYPO|nr:hypothetical protein FSARC_15068 [Fusarium sarcochroum]
MSFANGKIPRGQAATLGPPLAGAVYPINAWSSHAISYSVLVEAPALVCLEKLIDTSTWPSWNTLTPRGNITHAPPITDATTNASELQDLISRSGYLYSGMEFSADVYMFPSSARQTNTAAETVDRVERFETADGRLGYRVTWRYTGMPYFLAHNERVHEFIQSKDSVNGRKVTEYIGWETFGGLTGFIMKYFFSGHFVRAFQRWRDDFKAAMESS